jgi:hypothetical protein
MQVFVRYNSNQISAVYYVNTTSSLESDVERHVSMARARQALELALLAAHVRSTAAAAAAASGDKAQLRAARRSLPVLQYRHGPGASNLRRSQLAGECWDGTAVNARIRSGLPAPPGLGFAPPAARDLVPALESLHRQGLIGAACRLSAGRLPGEGASQL